MCVVLIVAVSCTTMPENGEELNTYDAMLYSMRDIDLRSLKKMRCLSIVSYIFVIVCSSFFIDLLHVFFVFHASFCCSAVDLSYCVSDGSNAL